MTKHLGQVLILAVIVLVLALFQYSFISALPSPWRQFNLLLSSLVFFLFFLDFNISLLTAFISGFFLDLLSFNFFGFYLILFFATLLLIQWVLKNWLTNRSLYTFLALMLIAIIFYNLLSALLLYLFSADYNIIFLGQASFWLTMLYQSMWSLFFALILFNLAAAVSKRIKPFFLESKSFYDRF